MTKVKLTTSMGDIVLELNEEKAPITVANFVQYATAGHYNGTIFHRVIADFMASTQDFRDQMRVLGGPLTDEEEDGLDAMLVEDLEDRGRVLWMWAVVDGEQRLHGAVRLARREAAEPFAAWHQRADGDGDKPGGEQQGCRHPVARQHE